MGNTFDKTVNLKNKPGVNGDTKPSRSFVDAARQVVSSSRRSKRKPQSWQEWEGGCMDKGCQDHKYQGTWWLGISQKGNPVVIQPVKSLSPKSWLSLPTEVK